jgi:hypothetical protein
MDPAKDFEYSSQMCNPARQRKPHKKDEKVHGRHPKVVASKKMESTACNRDPAYKASPFLGDAFFWVSRHFIWVPYLYESIHRLSV